MRRKILGICGVTVLMAFAAASVAKADDVDSFTYTVAGDTFVWQLLASPNVDPSIFGGFMVSNVGVSENGGAPVLTELAFFPDSAGGGFGFNIPTFFADVFGDQLYTGPDATPTFKLGTFPKPGTDTTLKDFGTPSPDGGVTGIDATLVISKVSVPEPSTYMLLIVGSLGLLLVTKRKG